MKEKIIASRIGIDPNTFVRWKKPGAKPEDDNLKALALFFSEITGIPIENLKDGRALLDEDFERINSAYGLPESHQQQTHQAQPPHQSTEIPPLSTITDHELRFLANIRRLIHGRPDMEVGEISLNQILELETLAGPGSENHRSLIRMIQGLRHAGNQIRKKADPPDPETDEK